MVRSRSPDVKLGCGAASCRSADDPGRSTPRGSLKVERVDDRLIIDLSDTAVIRASRSQSPLRVDEAWGGSSLWWKVDLFFRRRANKQKSKERG